MYNNEINSLEQHLDHNNGFAKYEALKALRIIKRQKAEIERLQKFKYYFDDLYGMGLEIANWHYNGMLEPFDNFYDSAIKEMTEVSDNA